ncbi:hypothetical protein [Ancylobacter mangrovi]|uniref:hypothetical protein n=1 Tax=Ancylobacter mangrovi TaxID=2972472 RepID=UPI0021638E6F|nr:hypothetical protein [Ancylobacter mangrovi]MCS0501241.1 hypothetical protein [Ancylobacter mangrovi]
MHARTLLTIALALITAVAIVWFISSFFVLQDENPRTSLDTPIPVALTVPAVASS